MHYRLLGTTQAFHDDGTPVALGGARLRAVLAALALRPGRTVPVGVLVEEVWDGDPPADASGAVQALIGRLRRVLGHAAVARAEGGGYRLRADGDDVDLHRFDRLTKEGARALGEGDAEKAAALLDDALGLWQGPVLADLPDRTARAARWEARHLEARRSRLTAALALGRAEEALLELVALCAEYPMDERLQALRIRALRDADRAAEALTAYEEIRHRLADTLGTTPGRELRALHGELLNGYAPPAGGTVRAATDGATREGTPYGAESAAHEATPFGAASAGIARAGAGEALPAGAHGRDGTHSGPGSAGTGTADGYSGEGPCREGTPSGGASGATGHAGAAVDPPHPADGAAREGTRTPVTAPGTQDRHPPPGNLRARLTSFVGRDADIDAIHGDLRRARLVTLLGPGGAGKTRLSQEAAERAVAKAHDANGNTNANGNAQSPWPDGVWLAELAPVDDPETVPEAVLTALGARETVLRGARAEEIRAVEGHGDHPLVRLTEHCSRRRMLLLLDNCEHVVAAAATLAEQLLENCPGLTVLATSREPLGVPGELVRPVDPLPGPMALRLLAERGAAARPGFRIDADPATAAACAEICRRLDGLPLAIELAAARLRMLTPRQIADRLDDRFRLLTSGSRTVLPRQQTLRAVVDWSWELLDAPERAALRRLSVFAGGCDLPAAEDVCGEDALGLLGSLIDKSLVVAAPTPDGQMRYRLLETVAEYAAEHLDQAGERAEAERRHLVHYRDLARTTDPLLRGHGQRAAIDRFQREYENLRTALRRAVAARDEHEALQLVLSLSWYWQMRNLRSEARHWATAVGELGPDPFAEPVEPAPPVFARFTDAPPPMEPELLKEARRSMELVRVVFMDYDVDRWTNPEGLERLRRIRRAYHPGLPQACRPPTSFWFFAVLLTGDGEQLKDMVDQTIEACRAFGYEWELAAALQGRASIFANRSDWAGDTAQDADEALEIFRRLGDAWGVAESLSARGEARERLGQYPLAAEDFTAAIDYAQQLGAQGQIAVLRSRLGGILMEMGDGERGEALLRDVLATNEGAYNESSAIARIVLALWLGHTGRIEEARAEIELLKAQFNSNTLALFEGMVTGFLAWLDLLDGAYESALTRARLALAKAHDPLTRMVAPQMQSVHMVTAAGALAMGRPERARDAARLLGAADALLPPGHHGAQHERENRVRSQAAVLAALTEDAEETDDADDAYEVAYAEGAGLTMEEAVALV